MRDGSGGSIAVRTSLLVGHDVLEVVKWEADDPIRERAPEAKSMTAFTGTGAAANVRLYAYVGSHLAFEYLLLAYHITTC